MKFIKAKGKRYMALLIVCVMMVGLFPTGVYAAEGDFTFNSFMKTITGYNGPSGAVEIPATIGEVAVEHIGEFVFEGKFLTLVTIPNSVTSLGDSVFSFNELTSITIPNSVTSLGAGAFYHNDLTSVTIPNSVTSIGLGAFCYNDLTSITMERANTAIGDYMLANNNNFRDAYTAVGGGIGTYIGTQEGNWTKVIEPVTLNVSAPGTLPTGVTHASNVFTIGTGANNTTINVTGTALYTHTIVVATDVTNLTLILNGVSITSNTKSPIDLKGTANVTIQLADGTTNLLDASNAGVGVGPAGICTNGTATITISGNTGRLIAKGGHSGAGIGGGIYSTGGNITISGGTITATGGHSGAGIGGTNGTVLGGTNGTGGNITISGGTVTATGGNCGAGIGGGYYGTGGTINISGGTVTATGGTEGAGIGGGTNSAGGTVTISDGTVTATGGQFGAGIGGGNFGAGGTIAISGGTVTATGGNNGAGIGGGYGRPGGAITIGDNAVVMAVSSSKPAIEAVSGSSGNVINARFISAISTTDDTFLKCNSNVLRLPATYKYFAFSATALSSVALYADQSCTTKLYDIVTDPGGATAIPVSTPISNTPTLVKTAAAPTYTMTESALTAFSSQTAGYASAPAAQTVTITNTGNQAITLTQPTSTNYNIGALSTTSLGVGGTATFTVQPKTGFGVGSYNETISISGTNGAAASVNAEFSVTAPTSLDVSVTGSLPTGVTYASNVFTIGTGATNTTINVIGTTTTKTIAVATEVTNLTLILNGVSITSTTNSPIDLQGNANVNIQLADGTTNTLNASAATNKAGICTNGTATINISGTTGGLTAAGGYRCAGIGGGIEGAGGTITISGGIITAKGGQNGAGIGGGIEGAGGTITISGGSVTATGGASGAGIGGGIFGAGGTIAISGGTVTATEGGSPGAAGIGGGLYGESGNITIGVNAVIMVASRLNRAINAVSGSGNVINAKFSDTISTTNDTYLKCNSNVLRLPANYQYFAFSATAASTVVIYSDQSCTTKLYDIVTDPGGATSIPVSTHIYDTPTPVKTVAATTYTMTASALTAFSSQTAGYASAQAAQTVTITNTGNQAITLTQPTSTNYNIGSLSTTSLGVGGTATFTVQPKTGLGVGTYNETISISGTNGAAASVNAEFSVTAAVLTGTVALTIDSSNGQVTAAATGGNIGSSGTLTYTWTGGATGIGTTNTPTLGTATTCTVTATGVAGSISATETVYKVTVTKSGNTGTDDASIASAYGKVGDSISIAYNLSNSGTQSNTLTYSGSANEPATITTAGSGTSVYTIAPGDAASGTVALTATFTHAASDTTPPYTVTYNGNGATSGSVEAQTTNAGAATTVAANGFTKTGYTFTGWNAAANGSGAAYAAGGTVPSQTAGTTVKLYAQWTENTYSVSGEVSDNVNTPVIGASVKLMKGNEQIGTQGVTTASDGTFAITGVPNGTYNLVVSKVGITVTSIVVVNNSNNMLSSAIKLPNGNTSSVVEVKGSQTPQIVVGNLDGQFSTTATENDKGITIDDNTVVAGGGSVEIKLTAEIKDNTATNASTISAAATSNGNTVGIFIDLSVLKTVKDSGGVEITSQSAILDELPSLIDVLIPLPIALQGQSNYVVYRYHGSVVDNITTTANADGEKIELVDNNTTIKLTVKKFSTYAIAYKTPTPTTPTPTLDPTPTYTITAGAGGIHTVGSDGILTITCSGALADLTGIYVNNVLVDASNYTLESGSTILTLKASYLDGLSIGTHTLKFVYGTMSAETTFTTIQTETTTTTSETTPSKDNVPKTGDSTPVAWLFALVIASGVGLCYFGKKKKLSK